MINVSAAPQAEPVYWPCGRCRAESGQLCRTTKGKPCTPHADRHHSVALWVRYGLKNDEQTTYRVQRTAPAFSLDQSTRWHVLDDHSRVVAYCYTKREAQAWVRTTKAGAR